MTSATSNEPTNPHASQPAEVLYVPYPRNGKISDSNLPTLGKPTGNQAEFEHNAEERCAVVLVLDISASMTGEPIRLLNEAVNKFHRNLLEDPLIAAKVDVGMVMFNHNVSYHDFINATEFQPPTMQPSGGTVLSFPLNMALDMVAKRKDVYKINGISYHRPWIVLITDGYPEHDSDDELYAAGERVRAADANKECSLFTITCGTANETTVAMLKDKITPPGKPPKKTTEANFSELFNWLSNSMAAVSQSSPSEQIRLEDTSGWEIA